MPIPSLSIANLLQWRPDGLALRRGVELALVLLLGVQAARMAWVLLAPIGPFGDAPPLSSIGAPAPAMATTRDPFFPSTQSVPAASGEAGDFTVYGVNTGAGSAILAGKDGRQDSWQVGQAIAPGVRLHAVDSDGAVLESGGRHRRVALKARQQAHVPGATPPTTLPASAPTATGPTPQTVDPAALLQQAGLRPRMREGRVDGYTLIPRGGDTVLRQAGLRAGDVLVAVNGNTLTPERLGELESDLAGRDAVELTVLRDGSTRTLTLRTPTP
ncbi:type II secretion system protein N [Lysobacter sp. A3-1-A15]|uniref:type II secretion system protein N n=1 Tax=Novilysobacter viscosus TaxID=3098602 RepID=UPI003982FEAA